MDLLRKATNPVINTLVGVYLAVLFFTPYITVNGESLTALEAFLKYGNVHWTYNYFLFSLAIPVLAYIFLILKKKFKSNIFEEGALLVWILGLIGQYIFTSNSPVTSIDESMSLNGILTLLISMGIIFYHLMALSIAQGIKKAVQMDKKIADLKQGRNVLYENTVLLNPSWFYFVLFYTLKPLPFIATDKEFIIGSDESIIIPFPSIKSIDLNHYSGGTFILWLLCLWLLSYITINLNDGKSYRVSWASHLGIAWIGYLNLLHTNRLTKQLYEDLKGVFEKREKVSDAKWRDFYEKHRKNLIHR